MHQEEEEEPHHVWRRGRATPCLDVPSVIVRCSTLPNSTRKDIIYVVVVQNNFHLLMNCDFLMLINSLCIKRLVEIMHEDWNLCREHQVT